MDKAKKTYKGTIAGSFYYADERGVVYVKSSQQDSWRRSLYSHAGFIDGIERGYLVEVE